MISAAAPIKRLATGLRGTSLKTKLSCSGMERPWQMEPSQVQDGTQPRDLAALVMIGIFPETNVFKSPTFAEHRPGVPVDPTPLCTRCPLACKGPSRRCRPNRPRRRR